MNLLLTRNLSKVALAALVVLLAGCQGGVLDPKGQIGVQEKELIITATILMLIVVVPVILMTLYFAWKYREGRGEAYEPKWSHSTKIETVVWVIPIIIIAILGVITYKSTHALNPYKPIESEEEPVTVEVVSLNWKWLFIYPDLGIATVNELAFPANVPVNFRITSAGTMNSFFIPQLGTQIYSMAGMETKLHLIADESGTYDGISANYSGHGFTGMQFKAIATPTREGFQEWVEGVKASGEALTTERYEALVKPSQAQLDEPTKPHPVEYFGTVKEGLFFDIIWEYMGDMGRIEFYGKPEYGAELPEGVILPKRERTNHGEDHGEESHEAAEEASH